MSNNWQFVNLEDIQNPKGRAIVSGPFGSNIGMRFFVPEGVPVIRGNNLTTDMTRFVDDGFVFVTEEKAKELGNCEALPGDLIFTAAGSLGQVGIIPDKPKYPKYIISNKQLRARLDPEKVDKLFVFYWLSSPQMVEHIQLQNTGSSVPLINLSIIRKLPVPLPPLPEQRAIAGILGALDDKIELNRRMNRALESLARAVFRQWFVDGEEVGDWESGKLGDVCEPMIGGDWGEEQEFEDSVPVICLRGVDLDNLRKEGYSQDAPVRWIKKSSLEKRQLSDCDILIAGSGIGPVGKPLWVSPEMLKAYSYPVIYSNFVKRVRAKSPECAVYVDRILFNMRERNEIWDYVNGTSIPNLDDKGLLKYGDVIFPTGAKMKAFYEYIKPIYAKLYNKESRALANLRDSLLPKLMRGEARVK